MANQSKRGPIKRTGQKKTNHIRIVAGQWRGRKIPVVDADGLRPTADRVRETLFNWLQLDIPGRHCLDLFAGSGALGLEAASRGAASVTLVECAKPVAAQLKQSLELLAALDTVTLHESSAQCFLDATPQAFDVVFIDPPFDKHLHLDMVLRLKQGWLKPEALIYIECPTNEREQLKELGAEFQFVKDKTFGDVTALLMRLNA